MSDAALTVLCPVDGSECSDRALAHAAELCRVTGAGLVVLTVRPIVPVPALWLTAAAAPPIESPDAAERARDGLARDVRRVTDLAGVHLEVAEGDIVTEILRVAAERRVDTIVVGTHGLGGIDRLVLGSVAERVLRKATCSVMVVPSAAGQPARPAVILCGVDRAEASRRALDRAVALARLNTSRLVVVHAFEDFASEDPRFAHHFNTDACWRAAEPEIRAAYEAMIPADMKGGCDVELVTSRGRPYRVLLDAAKASSADLIVIGSAGWNPPMGSTAAHVVRQAACPVLVVTA